MPPASDRWPDEPDEPDPESRWGDPENDLVSVPSVETKGLDPGSEGGGAEVDPEVARRFWVAVVYANVALGGVSIGLLLALARGQLRVGGAAVAVGLLALYRTYSLYQTHREQIGDDGDGEDGARSGDGEGAVVADDGPDTEAEGEVGGGSEGESRGVEGLDARGWSGDDATDKPASVLGAGMQTVRDAAGDRYLLVKRSAESSRIRDPDTGEEEYRPNDALTFEEEAPLSVRAAAVPEPVRRVVAATHDDRSLGLVVELVDRGPVPAVELLATTDLCESDLHGLLTEFRAADLAVETRVHGERGYDATETARQAVETLRTVGDGAKSE